MRYYCLVMSVAFAVVFRSAFRGWLNGKIRQRSARKRSVNGYMAQR